MTDSPLTLAHRSIRSIAPPDVPVAGVLSTYGDETALFVEVDDVDARLWRCDDVQHVWAPIDLVRHTGGVYAVLPWCSLPLARLLADRRGEPLHGGEAVTLAVSLLRGTREALETWPGEDVVTGAWWVSENGRPLFVRGDGDALRTATCARLDEVATSCADAVVAAGVVRVREIIGAPGPVPGTDDVEQALFHLAAPRPVASPADVGAPRAVPASSFAGLVAGAGAGEEVPSGVGHIVRRTIPRLRERATSLLRSGSPRSETGSPGVPRPARFSESPAAMIAAGPGGRAAGGQRPLRRRVVVMAAVTTAVLGAFVFTMAGGGADGAARVGAGTSGHESVAPFTDGVAPTAGAASGAQASSDASGASGGVVGSDAPTSSEDPAAADAPAVDDDPATSEDPVIAATALLAQARTCAATGDPCASVVSSAAVLSAIPPDGPVELIDDYGGMAVIGVGEAPVSVLLERIDGRWRIRDVPSSAVTP